MTCCKILAERTLRKALKPRPIQDLAAELGIARVSVPDSPGMPEKPSFGITVVVHSASGAAQPVSPSAFHRSP